MCPPSNSGAIDTYDRLLIFSGSKNSLTRFFAQVPIFDRDSDTFSSIRGRSSTLFDIILLYGAKAAYGTRSTQYQVLHGLLRQRISDLVLLLSEADSASIDDIRALLVVASYSNSGAILVDIALRAANTIGLDQRLGDLLRSSLTSGESLELSTIMTSTSTEATDQQRFEAARVYYYLYASLQIASPSYITPDTQQICPRHHPVTRWREAGQHGLTLASAEGTISARSLLSNVFGSPPVRSS